MEDSEREKGHEEEEGKEWRKQRTKRIRWENSPFRYLISYEILERGVDWTIHSGTKDASTLIRFQAI